MMNIKKLGYANIYCWCSVFLPLISGVLVLFFGYSFIYYILGIPLLIAGIVCQICRINYLLKNSQFASKKRIIFESAFILLTIGLSMVFTSARLVHTETGFNLEMSGEVLETILFIVLYIVCMIFPLQTNKKLGKEYLKLIKEKQN